MSLNFIPKSIGDKALAIGGAIITIGGIALVITGKVSDLTGIAGVITGGMSVIKGMEEFLNGDTVDAVADVESGVKTIAANKDAAVSEAKGVAANPIPVVEAAAPVVAAVIDEKKVS